MGGVPILLALAAVTVDYGYQPDGKGGVEYIVQMTPEELEHAKQAGEISSVVDPSVRGRVSRFVVRVGKGKLPRDAGPPPPPGDTVAQAQAFDAAADRAFVPIPEMTASAAAPIPAMPDRPASPVTSAKPQDAPTMSYPSTAPVAASTAEDLRQRGQQLVDQAGQGLQDAANRTMDTMANAAADAVRDPLYRLNGAAPTAAGDNNPYRATATTNPGGANPATGPVGPPAPTATTNAPGMQMPNMPRGTATTATDNPNNAAYGQRDPQRDNQWNREPTASRTAAATPSTSPRSANSSTAAAGNFGAPPPGVHDPRQMVSGTNPQAGYADGSASTNLQNPTANPGYQANANQALGQSAAPASHGSGNVPPSGYTGGPPAGYQGAANTSSGQYAQGQNPQSQYAQGQNPQSQYAQGQNPQGQYTQGQHPQSQHPQSQYAQGQYGPTEQLASINRPGSSAPGYQQPPAYPYVPARPASLLPDAENREASKPGLAGRGPGGEEENRGLPQQVFNGLLLLSLVANAYLIIHMSKLIQRYRDLRVNLRTAAAGKSASSAPAAA